MIALTWWRGHSCCCYRTVVWGGSLPSLVSPAVSPFPARIPRRTTPCRCDPGGFHSRRPRPLSCRGWGRWNPGRRHLQLIKVLIKYLKELKKYHRQSKFWQSTSNKKKLAENQQSKYCQSTTGNLSTDKEPAINYWKSTGDKSNEKINYRQCIDKEPTIKEL